MVHSTPGSNTQTLLSSGITVIGVANWVARLAMTGWGVVAPDLNPRLTTLRPRASLPLLEEDRAEAARLGE